MDRSEEDMKFIGFFGIFKQSCKTIFSCKKLFTQITLSLILPLTLLFLANFSISNHIFYQIENNSLAYNININGRSIFVIDWIYYWLFKIAYYSLLTIFSLLSTAAIVFTIASVYTNHTVVFRQVIKIVSKIWKKLLVTFVFIYLALFVYNVIYLVTVFISISLFGSSIFGSVFIITILILYMLCFLYLTVVWQLAGVVTVLENVYGIKAMKKGKNLLNGKTKVGMAIAFVLYVFLLGLVIVYELFVEEGKEFFELAMIWRVMIGILCGIFVMILFLLIIVTQTVLYFVCKSYHQETIDKLSLSTYLGAYMEETAVYPKPGDEIQLGRTQAQEV